MTIVSGVWKKYQNMWLGISPKNRPLGKDNMNNNTKDVIKKFTDRSFLSNITEGQVIYNFRLTPESFT